jgi:hypothetical protein
MPVHLYHQLLPTCQSICTINSCTLISLYRINDYFSWCLVLICLL